MPKRLGRYRKLRRSLELDSCLAFLFLATPAVAAGPGTPSTPAFRPSATASAGTPLMLPAHSWSNVHQLQNIGAQVSPISRTSSWGSNWHGTAATNTAFVPQHHGAAAPNLQVIGTTAATLSRVNLNPFDSSLLVPLHTTHGGIDSLKNATALIGQKLDLMSTSHNIILGSALFGQSKDVTIDVGTGKQTFHAGMKVTASEYVAIVQSLSGDGQQVSINARGVAVGGSFIINEIASGIVNELVVPKNVIAVDYLSSGKSIHLTGDLINYGTIYGVAADSNVVAGGLFASDITNARGGVISTLLPNSSQTVDLSLSACNNIVNSGTISSSGALTLAAAQGSIINSGRTIGSQVPTIKAGSDVNLLLGNGNLANHGLIQSTGGSINIAAPQSAASININAQALPRLEGAGVFSAAAGNINVGRAASNGDANINMLGGDYTSQQLNINAGKGLVNGYVGNVSGVTNITAGAAQFGAATADFKLGTLCVSGDPTYYNTAGSLTLASVPATNGADLALIASGDVVVQGGTIDTTNPLGGNGGALTIIAGANATATPTSGKNDTTTTVTITNSAAPTHGSATGGAIDISGVTSIDTEGTITPVQLDGTYAGGTNGGIGGKGGNVQLIAFSGSGASALTPGSINAGLTGSINTYGGGPGASASSGTGFTSGNITVIGGATSDPSSGAAIRLPAMFSGTSATSSQSGTGGGNISIATATPDITSTVNIKNGTMTSGLIAVGALQNSSVTIGAMGGDLNPIKQSASTTAWQTAATAFALNYLNTAFPAQGNGPPFPNLTLDPTLTAAAFADAQYLAQSGHFAHFTLNGAGPGARSLAFGIDVSKIAVGENAGDGLGGGSTVAQNFKVVSDQMWAEPNSGGNHHTNLVNNKYVGIGFATAGTQIYFIEDLSTTDPSVGLTAPTGVVPVHAGVAGGVGIANSLGGPNQTNAEPATGGSTLIPVSINTGGAVTVVAAPNPAGSVNIQSGGSVQVAGTILANGGSGAAGYFNNIKNLVSPGGNGGTVTITAKGNINLNGVQASGGLGGGTFDNTPLGAGGNGGTVSITSNNGNVNITPGYPFSNALAIGVAGGAGGQAVSADFAGAAGGQGGKVTVSAPAGSIVLSAIDAGGGGGAGGAGGTTGGVGGAGGAGGTITLSAKNVVDVQFYLNASGGGGGGAGGKSTSAGGGGGGASLGLAGGGGASDASGNGGGGGGAVGEVPGLGGPTSETINNQSSNGTAGVAGAGGAHGLFGGGGGGGLGGASGDNGGAGGDLGSAGQSNKSATRAGGAGGAGGTISVSGGAVTVQGTVQGLWDPYQIRITAVPTTVGYAQGGDSLLALGTGGNVTISSSSLPLLYSTNDATKGSVDLGSATRNITPNWAKNYTVGGLTDGLGVIGKIEAGGQANAITINGTGKSGSVASGTFGLASAAPASVSITEPSGTVVVTNGGAPVTAAELAAVVQVATSGNQLLTLSNSGDATGGSVSLNPYNLPTAGFSTLVVPAAVTVINQLNSTAVSTATINGVLQMNTFGAPTIAATTVTMNGGTINALQGLTFTSGTVLTGNNISLLAASGTVTLGINTISATADGGTGVGGTINISALKLNFASSSTKALVLNADGTGSGGGGSIDLAIAGSTAVTVGTAAGNLTVSAKSGGSGGNGGDITVSAAGALTFNTAGLTDSGFSGTNGNVSLSGAAVTFAGASALAANSVSLTATAGSVASAATPFLTTSNVLSLTASADVYVQNTGNVVVTTNIAGQLSLSGSGSLAVTDNAGLLNVLKLSGASVSINGIVGKDETINNTGTISAATGNIDITSTPDASNKGGNLLVSGGGQMNVGAAGQITLLAALSPDGKAANTIEFVGNQTFNGTLQGTATLKAAGVNQSVMVDVAATVTGNEALTVLSPLLIKNGIITGNPLIFSTGGIIADNTGAALDISKLGPLVFDGKSLAIISKGDITDGGLSNPINLTGSIGAGGSLVLIAGFDFTPASTPSLPPDGTNTYTLLSATAGNINLASSDITTTGKAGAGGSVSAYANGTININKITTTGTGAASGNVVLIGQGITVGNLDTANAVAVHAGSVSATAASVTTSGTVTLRAGSIQSGSLVANVSAGNININTTAGQLTLNAGAGTVLVQDSAKAVVLAGSNSGSSFTLTLTAPGATLDMQNGGAALNAATVSLTTNGGNIGAAQAINLTAASTALTFATGGGSASFISNNTIVLGPSTAGAINLTADTLTTNGSSTAAGNFTINVAKVTVGGADTLTGAAIAINGPVGKDLTLINGGALTATAGNIDIVSTPDGADVGGNLLVSGGGNMNVSTGKSINLTAAMSADQLSPNVVHFTGNQTFNGDTNVTALGDYQSIVIDAGVTLTETNPFTMNLNTSVIANKGIINGTVVMNTPNGFGTYASDGSSLDLNGLSLTFNGQCLAILSAGDIVNSGAAATIDLSNAGGNGGRLYLLSGFKFSPTTGGKIAGPGGGTSYTLTGQNSGNINLSTVNINTSGSNLGGNVYAYAAGSVALGAVTTTGKAANGGNINIVGTGVTVGAIDTSGVTPASSGLVNIAAATVKTSGTVVVQNGLLSGGTISANTPGGSISLSALNAGTQNVILTATAGGVTSSGGISAGHLTASTGAAGLGSALLPVSTSASSISASSAGGDVFVQSSSPGVTLIGVNSANNFNLTLTGAAASITVASGQTVTAVNQASLSATANITFQAGSSIGAQNILLDASQGTIVTPQTIVAHNASSGGSIVINAKNFTWLNAGGQNLLLDASALANGKGGSISLTTTDAQTVGTGIGQIQMNASGGKTSGDGGSAALHTSGATMTVADTLGLVVAPASSNGNGGSIDLAAASIAWPTAGSQPLALDAGGKGSGAGGSVSVSLTGPAAATIGAGAGAFLLSATSGAAGGAGGQVQFTTAGALTVDASAITVGPRGAGGDGGKVLLSAASIANASKGPLTLDASGLGVGNGGTVSVKTQSTAAVTLGTSGQFLLSANAGAGGGNGGKVVFSTGGNLTDTVSGISVAALVSGAGGTVDLTAGASGPGLLVVQGSPALNGVGTGNGGSLILKANSTTAFVVGSSSTKNGVQGAISVNGVGGGKNGNLSFTNAGGGLTVSEDLVAVDSFSLASGVNGAVGLSKLLGGSATAAINIAAAGTGKVTSTKNLQATVINVTSSGGNIGNLNVIATDVSALTSGKGTVSIANVGPAGLNITGASGAAITLKTINNLTTSGAVTGTAVTITSSAKTVGAITVGGVLTATAGGITIKTTGDVSTNKALTALKSITLTTTGVGAKVTGSGSLDVTASTGTLALVSSGTGGIIDTSAFSALGAGKSVAMTAAKGDVTTGAIGALHSPATVAVTALNNLSIGGAITTTSNVTIKTTSTLAGSKLTVGSIAAATGNIAITGASDVVDIIAGSKIVATTGSVAVTASGKAGNIAADPTSQLDAFKTLTMTAAKGSLAAGVIGSTLKPTTVTLTALNDLTAAGSIAAQSGVTIKSTTTLAGHNLTFGSVSTLSGNILIVGASDGVNSSAGAAVSVGSLAGKAKTGTIKIEDINKTAGSISLANGTSLSTFVTAPGKSGAGAIDVVLVKVPSKGVNSTPPAGVAVSGVGGAFFGINGIDGSSTGTINLQGGTVVFDTNGLPASSIKLNNVSITADPPIVVAPSIAHGALIPAGALPSTPAPSTPSLSSTVISSNVLATQTFASFASFDPSFQKVSAVPPVNNLVSRYSWISDTEIASGEIPALVLGAVSSDVVPEVSALVEHQQMGPHYSKLGHGTVLLAPEHDTLVATPFGDVSIGAGAVALVMTWDDGLAVYDLHDSRSGAVTVSCRERTLELYPGRHVCISGRSKAHFAEINPAQAFAYRHMQEGEIADGWKLFQAEFALPQAFQTVTPLRQISRSTSSEARKLAGRMLKTAAILNQFAESGEAFRRVPRPPLTCLVDPILRN